jgi:hemerythrin-like domain-containing protein
MIFTELIDFIERHSDIATAEQIIEEANLNSSGAFTAVGNYPHQEVLLLVGSAASILQSPSRDLMRQFGKELFSRLYDSHPQFFEENVDNAPLFLERIQQHIHDEVIKLYPDSNPPRVLVSKSEGLLQVTYESHRPFALVALGLIEGCYEYFGRPVEVEFDDSLDETSSNAQFSIRDDLGE